MAGKEKTVNYVVKAVKPVPFILALFQLAGKIIVGGMAIIVVFMLFSISLISLPTTDLSGGLGGSGIDGQSKRINTVAIGGNFQSKNKLLIVDLSGTILGAAPFPAQDPYLYTMLGVTFGHQLENQIMAAAEDDSIKGIFIHTRTPGGTIHGSQAIFNAIKKYQDKTGNPVVTWIEGISASGGVYSTASADAIYAAPGSLVGSIGVNGGSIVYYDDPIAVDGGMAGGGITTRGGIEVQSLHAGEGKDFGNPFRKMTDRELEISDEGLQSLYKEFVSHVSNGRGIAEDKIVDELGAHIFGTMQAEAHGLIDATLGQGEALNALAFLAQLKQDDYVAVRRMPMRTAAWDQLVRNSMITSEVSENSELPRAAMNHHVCDVAMSMPMAFHGSLDDLCGDEG